MSRRVGRNYKKDFQKWFSIQNTLLKDIIGKKVILLMVYTLITISQPYTVNAINQLASKSGEVSISVHKVIL